MVLSFNTNPNPEYFARLALEGGSDTSRMQRYSLYYDYYLGNHAEMVPVKDRGILERYAKFRANIIDVIVDALTERLVVTGLNSTSVDGKDNQTVEARLSEIWQRNRMDEDAGIVHHEAVLLGDGFVIVDWDQQRGIPRLNFNPATAMAVTYDDVSNKVISRATKTWDLPDLKTKRQNVYYPDRIERYFMSVNKFGQYASQDWLPFTGDGQPAILPWTDQDGQPLGVPVFHFRNKGKGEPYGHSEITNVIPLQDAINKTMVDLLLVLDRQGWPQLWAKGKQPPGGWKVGPGMIISSDNPDFELGALNPASPDGLLAALMQLVNTAAGRSRTPQHLFHIEGAYPTGEALKTADAGLAGKVRDRQVAFGNVWEDVCSMALRLDNVYGDTDWPVDSLIIQTQWQDAEMRQDLAHAQYISTLAPWLSDEQVLREAGYTKPEIDKIMAERQAKQQQQQNLGASMLDAFHSSGMAPMDMNPNGQTATPQAKPGGQSFTRNPDR